MSTKKYDAIPDFLIIGAGKSGTTSLNNYLKQHPQIFIPVVKEPNFFGYEHTRVEDFNGDQDEINHFNESVTTLDKYLALFADARPDQIKGETSNTYLYHDEAPERIKHYNPDVKLIAIFRQPAGRLYSRFLHLARENVLPTQHFEDCLDRTTVWWRRNDLIKEGMYYKNLSRFYSIFPKENIRVYLYEDFNSEPAKVLQDILTFLGADSTILPDLTVRYNQSGFVKNKYLDKIYGQKSLIVTAAKSLLPERMMDKLKSNVVIQRTLNDLRGKNLARPKMDPEVRHKLTHEVYGEDITRLQELIGRDLSHWFKDK